MSAHDIINKIEKILIIKLEQLKNFDLYCNCYTLSQKGQLKGLKLTDNKIDNEKLEQIISNLKGLISLSELNISRNHISDISSLRELISLTYLA